MTVEIQKIYRLGEFELDPNKRLLKREDGKALHLSHKPFQVLLYFIEHRERMVSRQELLDKFWDGRDVYDVTLTKCVGAIRKALGENTETPRFIETRWAEGYRYIGPVEEIEGQAIAGTQAKPREADPDESQGSNLLTTPAESLPGRTRASNHSVPALAATAPGRRNKLSRGQYVSIALGAALLIGGGVLAFVLFRPALPDSLATTRSLAVLPLKNVPDDANYEYLSDGITESLITALSQ